MTAFGYVRKSVVADPSQTLSPRVQEERIRALAAAHGDDDVEVLTDLDVSGAKVEQRRGYVELKAAIESGDAHAVYAYDLSRLHRNTREALAFFEMCEERRVPVRLVAESIDTSGPTGRLMLTILAAMNAWTSQVSSAKVRASLERRERETGQRNGGRHYDNPEVVVAAVREAGSYTGAAKLLNARKVATRNSRGIWHATSVRSIVSRVAPDEFPATARGAKVGPRDARFARVLRCSIDGSVLTPSYDQRTDLTRYYCHAGSVLPHGRKTVPEHKLLRQMSELVEGSFMVLRKIQRGDPKDDARREALDAKRARVLDLASDGMMTKDEARDRLDAIAEEERTLNVRKTFVRLDKPVGVRDDPPKVNAYLTRVLDHVTVDMSGAEGRGGEPAFLEVEWRDRDWEMNIAMSKAIPPAIEEAYAEHERKGGKRPTSPPRWATDDRP